ncbi:MAG: helix-turn-helix transcriptional regulator [Ruminococcus sp.]|nr:helix-turn-helix transcriptional regulator [Ruminococcus sp.]
MHINKVGYNHFHEPDFFISRPEGSGDYLMLLIKTPALFMIGGREINAAAGSVLLYKKGEPQFYRAKGGSFGNDWFHFLPDQGEESFLPEELGIPYNTVLRLDSTAELSVMINMMCHEHFSVNTHRQRSIDLLLRMFFLKLSEKLELSADGEYIAWHDRLSDIRTKIYNEPGRPWTIDSLAKELGMSRSSFQHTYKKVFGVTPMNDVIAARTEHACYLLSTTDLGVASVASQCGYSSEIHFMRQFKQRTGLTPTGYRFSGKM